MNAVPNFTPSFAFNPTMLHLAFELFFYVLLLAFVVQACFLGYHWFTYGSERRISMIALCTYLCGGAILLLTYASGLSSF